MKIEEKKKPKTGFSPDFLFLGLFFPIFIPGPILGPIWFPISGLRPETYFLAGRLGRNPTPQIFNFTSLAFAKEIPTKTCPKDPSY